MSSANAACIGANVIELPEALAGELSTTMSPNVLNNGIAIPDRFDNPFIIEALEFFSVDCNSPWRGINGYPVVHRACSEHPLIHSLILAIAHSSCELEPRSKEPRDEYQDDAAFMKIYEKASPKMQCMMDLAQMNGARRGMILRLTLRDIDDARVVWFTLKKGRRTKEPRKPKLANWTPDLRAVIDRARASQ